MAESNILLGHCLPCHSKDKLSSYIVLFTFFDDLDVTF